jgi:CMP-N-acetylneuraminic acid synthetase
VNILITICARGGSKGIPGKNIKLIGGKPLIAYTIDLTNKLKSKWGASVALSTDDLEIKSVAAEHGVYSNYLRPEYLSTDAAGKIDTIRDLLLYEESLIDFKYDFILDLDVTSPLRTLKDLEDALELMISKPLAKSLFSVNNASRNPYFNMVEQKESGYYNLVTTLGNVMTRQSAPKVYDLNASLYFYRRIFFSSDFKTGLPGKIYVVNEDTFIG